MVKRRHVYHLAGYDPTDADAQYRRFVRQLDIFQATWNIDASVSQLSYSDDQARAWWTVASTAAEWHVNSVYEVLLCDDIVRRDGARPLLIRFFRATIAYFDFIATGTMFRYAMASPRYALFFLFPPFALALFVVIAWLAAGVLVDTLGLIGVVRTIGGAVIGIVVFFALLRSPGRPLRVLLLLDDWTFAHDYLLDRRPDIDARLDLFADAIVAGARDAAFDEIVIIGHSLGAMLALDVLTRAFARDRQLGNRGAAICLLTVGATIPKFTLHPRAEGVRRKVAGVVAETSILWAEIQARADAISFYKFDPVALKRIGLDQLAGKPVIQLVQIHEMVQPKTYTRIYRNVLRMHYQSVMANDRRASYDYFLAVCGPASFPRWTKSPGGLLDFVATDGSYRDLPADAAAATPAS